MANEKPVSKKDIQELLDGQTKSILGAVDKKVDVKVSELAVLMRDAFQTNQDLFVGEIKLLKEDMNGKFKQVVDKIDNLSRNAVDVVRQEEFNKLDKRVTDVEGALNLKLKKA